MSNPPVGITTRLSNSSIATCFFLKLADLQVGAVNAKLLLPVGNLIQELTVADTPLLEVYMAMYENDKEVNRTK